MTKYEVECAKDKKESVEACEQMLLVVKAYML